jgi:hypothetical protein
MCTFKREVFPFKFIFPAGLSMNISKAEKTIKDKAILDDKIAALCVRYDSIFTNGDANKPNNDKQAAAIVH